MFSQNPYQKTSTVIVAIISTLSEVAKSILTIETKNGLKSLIPSRLDLY